MWIILNLYWISYSIACFFKNFIFLVFWPWGTWDPSSPTKDWTHTLCIGRQSLKHWPSREIPWKITFIERNIFPKLRVCPWHSEWPFTNVFISQLQRRDLQSCRNAQHLPSCLFFFPLLPSASIKQRGKMRDTSTQWPWACPSLSERKQTRPIWVT